MFGPKNGRFFPRRQQVRCHEIIGADGYDLIVGNACRLTKRRVVGESISAAVDVAGLDDRHLLDAGGKNAAGAFALDHRVERQQHFRG